MLKVNSSISLGQVCDGMVEAKHSTVLDLHTIVDFWRILRVPYSPDFLKPEEGQKSEACTQPEVFSRAD